MFLHALHDAVLVQEVHLVFGGMYVHVDVVRGDLQAAVVPEMGSHNQSITLYNNFIALFIQKKGTKCLVQ